MLQRLSGSFDRIDLPKPPPELRLPVPGQRSIADPRPPKESHRTRTLGLKPGERMPVDFGLLRIEGPESTKNKDKKSKDRRRLEPVEVEDWVDLEDDRQR